MAHTYGQIKDGKLISFPEFYSEISRAIKFVSSEKVSPITARSKYEAGLSV